MRHYSPIKEDRRHASIVAITLALAVAALATPVVQAAVSSVRIRSSQGDPIESRAVKPMGIFEAKGTNGAAAVRTYSGGGGLLGAGDCTASTQPAQGPLPNTVQISNGNIVTRLIVTGTGTIRVTSQELGPIPLANFTVNAENPNESVDFGNGLTASSQLTFTGIDGTACNFIVLGQGAGDDPLTAP